MSTPKFLLFGDSITQYAFQTVMYEGDNKHYFALGPALSEIYVRKADIVHKGFSGYNSRWALRILPSILDREPDISIATIFFGSNDAVSKGPQHISLPEYESNIRQMISIMKSKDIKPILIGPAMPDEDAWGKHSPEELENGCIRNIESFKTYSDAASIVAREENVPFVNLHTAFTKHGGKNWKRLLRDGLHFSGEGYEVFYSALMKAIEAAYPEYLPDNLPMQYPTWREIAADPTLLEHF